MAHKYVKDTDVFSTSRNGVVPKPTQQEVSDSKFLNADGSWKTPQGGGGGGGVSDVQVDGQSVVDNGVAKIPALVSRNDSEGTAISNLDNIPLNTVGHILLSSSIQPFGGSNNMNVAYMKFGISNSSLTEYNSQLIIVTRCSTGETYVNSKQGGTTSWVGWVKLSNTFDPTISNPSNGQTILYQNGSWINSAIPAVKTYDSDTEITNLNNIPNNSAGHILLAQSISPYTEFSGNMNVAFLNIGYTSDNTKTLLFVCRLSTGVIYCNTRYSSSWTGWVQLNGGGSGGGVTDVQVDGQSVVNQGVANLTTPDLVDLPDVNVSNITDGQILKWDATNSKWVNASENAGGVQFNLFTKAFISGDSTISRDRTDFSSYSQIVIDLANYLNKIITITNSGSRNFYGFTATVPASGDALLEPRIDSGGSLVINYTGTGGRYLIYDFTATSESVAVLGISVADSPIAISDLSDVEVSSPADGQVLKYNSTTGKWENSSQLLFLASYGNTSFAEILAAYKANAIVYCKASSNSNPATGAQLRQAFLAYVGGSIDNPTNFEFQYYRSVSTKSDSQQGDQVYVYTIKNNNTWSVIIRNTFTKIVAGTGLTSNYSNGVLTISLA